MKTIILFFAAVFGFVFAYIPYLWGDRNLFSTASILWSVVGGLFGIWVGYKVAKRWF